MRIDFPSHNLADLPPLFQSYNGLGQSLCFCAKYC